MVQHKGDASVFDDLQLLAVQIKEAYADVSPFIEEHTSAVCPDCQNVCCIDRHGTHEPADLKFIHTLGETPPPEPPKPDDTEACRHLSNRGCTIKRWKRPFRCTWYFCQPLLETMPMKSPREYRRFVSRLQRLVALRDTLINSE